MRINEKWDIEANEYTDKLIKFTKSTKTFLLDNFVILTTLFTTILYLTIAYLILVYK
jgi:hypothetical protein